MRFRLLRSRKTLPADSTPCPFLRRAPGCYIPAITALPTLFLIGDSTVKNSWDKGTDGLWVWGKPLESYFDSSKLNLENQGAGWYKQPVVHQSEALGACASAGEAGRLRDDAVRPQRRRRCEQRSRVAAGQWRRNTRRGDRPGIETVHTFGWYFRKYIADTKAKGAMPIVCSLIPRNTWRDGKVARGTGSYGTWAAEPEARRRFIHRFEWHHRRSLRQTGRGSGVILFPAREHTHPNWRGAKLNAECVVEGVKGLRDCPLAKYLSGSPNPVKPSTDPTNG